MSRGSRSGPAPGWALGLAAMLCAGCRVALGVGSSIGVTVAAIAMIFVALGSLLLSGLVLAYLLRCFLERHRVQAAVILAIGGLCGLVTLMISILFGLDFGDVYDALRMLYDPGLGEPVLIGHVCWFFIGFGAPSFLAALVGLLVEAIARRRRRILAVK